MRSPHSVVVKVVRTNRTQHPGIKLNVACDHEAGGGKTQPPWIGLSCPEREMAAL